MFDVVTRFRDTSAAHCAIAVALIVAGSVAGCDSTSKSDDGASTGGSPARQRRTMDDLVGRWELDSLLGEPIAISPPISLVITADGAVSGRSAVNGYSASLDLVQLRKGQFEAYPIASTMMAGPPERMELEARYFRGLERARSWSIDVATLVLHDDEIEVARFHRGSE